VSAIVGVVGGSGGVGASSFAADLAALAGASLLIDLDVGAGGIDVLLGVEGAPGARWSGLHVAGGYLEPSALRGGLPSWGRGAVLAADGPELDPAAVEQVLEVASCGGEPVVLDLPRRDCEERAVALPRCALVVVLVRADVPGVVAAHAVVRDLGEVPFGVVARRGSVGAEDAARAVGGPLLGVLPALSRRGPAVGRPSPATRRVAAGVLAGALR
jgi:hypothetical protein